MSEFEASIIIEAPIQSVWAFIADPRTTPQWDPGTLDVRQTSDGPIGIGTTLIATVDLLGRRELGLRINAYDPHRELGWEFTSGALRPTTTRYSVEALGPNRTKLTRTVQLRLRLPWLLLLPLLSMGARDHRADEVSNLKRILEASPESSAL